MVRLLPIYLVVFISFMGYALSVTVFPPLMLHPVAGQILPAATSYETRVILLGVLASLYPFGQFLGAPIIGALSDRHGRRPVLLVSLVGTALGYVAVALTLKFQMLGLLMASMAVTGFAASNIVIAQSVVTDVTKPEERGRYFGYVFSMVGFAFIFGPLVGGKFAAYFGYAFPFWIVLGLVIVALIWIAIGFKESLAKKEEVPYLEAFFNLKYVFLDRRIRMVYLINFLVYLAIYGFFRTYPMYLTAAFHLDISKLSEFVSWLNIAVIIGNLLIMRRLSRRFSAATLLWIGSLIMGVGALLVGLPGVLYWIWVTAVIMGFGIGFGLPGAPTYVSIQVEAREQGRVIGNNQSMQLFAEGLSSLLAGFLAAIFLQLPFIVCSVSAFLAAAILIWRLRRKGCRH